MSPIHTSAAEKPGIRGRKSRFMRLLPFVTSKATISSISTSFVPRVVPFLPVRWEEHSRDAHVRLSLAKKESAHTSASSLTESHTVICETAGSVFFFERGLRLRPLLSTLLPEPLLETLASPPSLPPFLCFRKGRCFETCPTRDHRKSTTLVFVCFANKAIETIAERSFENLAEAAAISLSLTRVFH